MSDILLCYVVVLLHKYDLSIGFALPIKFLEGNSPQPNGAGDRVWQYDLPTKKAGEF